jgi:hypothetical protein
VEWVVESSSEELEELCEGSASARRVFWEEGSKILKLAGGLRVCLFWRRIRYTTMYYYGSRCGRWCWCWWHSVVPCAAEGCGNLNLRPQEISTGVSDEPRMTDHNQNFGAHSHLTLTGSR